MCDDDDDDDDDNNGEKVDDDYSWSACTVFNDTLG